MRVFLWTIVVVLAMARMARPAPGRSPDLPALRREVIVIDHDTGQPVQHVLRL